MKLFSRKHWNEQHAVWISVFVRIINHKYKKKLVEEMRPTKNASFEQLRFLVGTKLRATRENTE